MEMIKKGKYLKVLMLTEILYCKVLEVKDNAIRTAVVVVKDDEVISVIFETWLNLLNAFEEISEAEFQEFVARGMVRFTAI